MTDDPIRLLAGRPSPDEREILRAGVNLTPRPEAKGAIWAQLSAKLPPPTTGGGASGSSGGGTAVGVWKSGALGVALGLLVAGGVALLSPPNEPEASQKKAMAAPAAIETPAVGNAARATPATPLPELAPPAAHRVAQPANAIAVPSDVEETVPTATLPVAENVAEKKKSQLADETRMLRDARAALRSGNASGALALLATSSKKYPSPVLGQEHEALSIQALSASGARAQAKTRAQAFVAHFPSSPLTGQLRSIAESP